MPIIYDQSLNRITVTGYSEATPCDFDDMYNADTGATNGRQLLDGVIAADPDTFSLDEQPQPADDKAVLLKIVCTARGGATCDISGTDAWDNVISETGIDISSGSAATTKRFKTVNASGTTVNGLQISDNFDIFQDRWGVISKQGSRQYFFEAKFYIGDDSTTTWFADVAKQIIFDAAINNNYVRNNAIFRLGELVDATEKTTRLGCSVITQNESGYHEFFVSTSGGTAYFYSCQFTALYTRTYVHLYAGRIWNCIFTQQFGISYPDGTGIFNVLIEGSLNYALANPSSSTIVEKIVITDVYSILYILDPPADVTVKNLTGRRNIQIAAGANSPNSYDISLVNADIDNWFFYWSTQAANDFYRQYTFKLQILNKDNNGIQNAAVSIKDKDANQVFSVTTDANGEISEQTVTYGTYEKATGNTLQSLSPHSLTISKSGYETYEKKFTFDEKIDWRVKLRHAISAGRDSMGVEFR